MPGISSNLKPSQTQPFRHLFLFPLFPFCGICWGDPYFLKFSLSIHKKIAKQTQEVMNDHVNVDSQAQRPPRGPMQCFNCGQSGHKANRCPVEATRTITAARVTPANVAVRKSIVMISKILIRVSKLTQITPTKSAVSKPSPDSRKLQNAANTPLNPPTTQPNLATNTPITPKASQIPTALTRTKSTASPSKATSSKTACYNTPARNPTAQFTIAVMISSRNARVPNRLVASSLPCRSAGNAISAPTRRTSAGTRRSRSAGFVTGGHKTEVCKNSVAAAFKTSGFESTKRFKWDPQMTFLKHALFGVVEQYNFETKLQQALHQWIDVDLAVLEWGRRKVAEKQIVWFSGQKQPILGSCLNSDISMASLSQRPTPS